MTGSLQEIWVYLAASPLLSLTLTLTIFCIATQVHRRLKRPTILHPIVVSVTLLVLILRATETPYETYFEGAQFIHFLLGPATVALAVPLYRQVEKVRRNAFPLAAGLACGSLSCIAMTIVIGLIFHIDPQLLATMAPKSVTTPVAMAVTREIGGLPSLTAALVLMTGIVGALLGPPLLDRLGIRDEAARGFALGTASHGFGTAQAFQEGEVTGAFSGLAMGFNALFMSVLLPLLWAILF